MTAAWSCRGHMLVAEIARRRLDAANVEKAEAMILQFHESGPFYGSPDFKQSACWADDLKMWQQYAMASWHFIDIPYNPENITIDDIPAGSDVVTTSQSMITSLRHPKAPPYILAFAMVNLIHFIGDVHQPLHATTRYSKAHPHGDRGGNAVEVLVDGRTVKLHALWDNICVAHAEAPHRPLSSAAEDDLFAEAEELTDVYKFPPEMWKMNNISRMAEESHEFAVNTTYAGIVPGEEVAEDYLKNCVTAAEGRVVLAGYRLGYILNNLLSGITVPDHYLSHYKEKVAKSRGRQERDVIEENEVGDDETVMGMIFREVLTVERKLYELGNPYSTVLSREKRVRDVRRRRRDPDLYDDYYSPMEL